MVFGVNDFTRSIQNIGIQGKFPEDMLIAQPEFTGGNCVRTSDVCGGSGLHSDYRTFIWHMDPFIDPIATMKTWSDLINYAGVKTITPPIAARYVLRASAEHSNRTRIFDNRTLVLHYSAGERSVIYSKTASLYRDTAGRQSILQASIYIVNKAIGTALLHSLKERPGLLGAIEKHTLDPRFVKHRAPTNGLTIVDCNKIETSVFPRTRELEVSEDVYEQRPAGMFGTAKKMVKTGTRRVKQTVKIENFQYSLAEMKVIEAELLAKAVIVDYSSPI